MPESRNTGADTSDPLTERFMSEYANAYYANVYPVQIEPLLGSGERFTVALVVIGQDGDYAVINTLPKKASSTIFGLQFGDAFYNLAQFITDDIHGWIKAGNHPVNWPPTIKGAEVGREFTTMADDLDHAKQLGAQVFSTFMAKALNEETTEEEESADTAQGGAKAWSRRVKLAVLGNRSEWNPYFERTISIQHKGNTLKYSFDFVGGRLATNFAWLTPHQLGYHMRSAEANLMHLEQLRSHQADSDLIALDHYEMQVYLPRADDPNFSEDDLNRTHDKFQSLVAFGDTHQIDVIKVHTVDAARDRILKYESAPSR